MAAYDSSTWQLFFATIASITAALVGLLFVALSLHLHAILADPVARARARETLGIFLTVLMLAILTLIPGQSARWLGGELLVFGLTVAAISLRLQGETLHILPAAQRPGHRRHIAPVNVGTGFILLAGASLLLERGGGLYWLVPGAVLVLGTALFNAWTLTVHIGER